MKIINQSKSITLAETATQADTFLKRLIGWMGKKEFASNDALYLTPCRQVHTFFMAKAIDVLFISKQGRLLYWQTLYPWQVSTTVKHCHSILELPAGTCRLVNCQPNDQLEYQNNRGW